MKFKVRSPKLIADLSVAIATVLAVASPAVATANTEPDPMIPLSSEDEQTTRDFFDQFEVAHETQDRLIAEFRAGDLWESLSTTALPIDVDTQEAEGRTWTLSTFADGSIRAESIGSESSSDGISTRGVDGCNYSVGKYGNFTNCHIYYWVGVVQLGFYANFSIVSGGNDKITSVWGSTLFAGGACSQNVPNPNIVKGVESSTGKAVAGLTAQATMCGINHTINFPSYLHVGGNRADHIYS